MNERMTRSECEERCKERLLPDGTTDGDRVVDNLKRHLANYYILSFAPEC